MPSRRRQPKARDNDRVLAIFASITIAALLSFQAGLSVSLLAADGGGGGDDAPSSLRGVPPCADRSTNGDAAASDLQGRNAAAEKVSLAKRDAARASVGTSRDRTVDGVPIHIVQFGPGRTATTLQFNVVCVSLFLTLRDDGDAYRRRLLDNLGCFWIETSGKSFNGFKPKVLKMHEGLDGFDPLVKKEMWVFATAATADDSVATFDDLKSRGYDVRYVQNMEEVRRRGYRIVTDYASIFGLSERRTAQLLEYVRYWEILRKCCGKQMSVSWRNELLNRTTAAAANSTYDVHSASHPACGMYDIDKVEGYFRKTALFEELSRYRKMKYMNRPSLMDGELTGTYCSSYNDLVRTQGVGFNEG